MVYAHIRSLREVGHDQGVDAVLPHVRRHEVIIRNVVVRAGAALFPVVGDREIVVRDPDGDRLGRDLQRAFALRDRVVVRLEVRAFGVGDRVRHFTLGHRRHAACRRDVGHFAGDKSVAAYRHRRLRQRRAVVRLLAALARQRHAALGDRQRAGDCRDRVVRRHVLRAVHDLVARRDRVVPRRRFGHVRHAARRSRRQRVAREQAAARYRDRAVRQRSPVVLLAVARRRDGQRLLFDRQRAGIIYNSIVAGVRADRSIARYDLAGIRPGVRLAARQGDARQRVAAQQSAYRHIGVNAGGVRARRSLCAAVIGVGLVDRSDRQSGRRDVQHAVRDREILVRIEDVIRCGDGEAVLRQTHGVVSDIRSGDRGRGGRNSYAGGRSRRPFAARDLVFNGEAAERLLRAVVRNGIGGARDPDLEGGLPDGVEVVVGQLFVRRDVRRLVSQGGIAVIFAVAVPQEVGRRRRICRGRRDILLRAVLVPALENVAGTGTDLGGRGDAYRLVDRQWVGAAAALFAVPAEGRRAVVLKPVDVSGRLRSARALDKDGFELNGIGHALTRALHAGNILVRNEGAAGIGFLGGVDKAVCRIAPLLDYPVREDQFRFARSRSGRSGPFDGKDVRIGRVGRRIRKEGTSVSIDVGDRDTRGAVGFLTPCGIDGDAAADVFALGRIGRVAIRITACIAGNRAGLLRKRQVAVGHVHPGSVFIDAEAEVERDRMRLVKIPARKRPPLCGGRIYGARNLLAGVKAEGQRLVGIRIIVQILREGDVVAGKPNFVTAGDIHDDTETHGIPLGIDDRVLVRHPVILPIDGLQVGGIIIPACEV